MTKQTEVEVVEPNENVDNQDGAKKTFTQEEVDKIIADRVAREKKQSAKEKAEAERVAKMNAEEKLKHDQEKIAERERELNRRELVTEATTLLANSGYSTGYAKFLIGEDLEETTDNFKEFEKMYKQDLDKSVEARFKMQGRNVATSIQENTNRTINIAEIAKKHRKR